MPRVKLFCALCRAPLLRYNKKGSGALVKLHPSRVTADRTVRPAARNADAAAGAEPQQSPGLSCPECRSTFARITVIGGQVYRKLIGGKVFVKGGVATR
jgi:hypothetical protein